MNLLIITNRAEIKEYILENIKEKDEILLYQESDGIKTRDQLNNITGISTGKISLCWEKLGIMEKITIGSGGRGKRLFDLEKIGINLLK